MQMNLNHLCQVDLVNLEDGKKLKNRITVSQTTVFAMAGLSDGERFTIVTCTPSPSIAHIHDRMPVILEHNGVDAWLSTQPYADVSGVLTPFTGNLAFEEDTPPPPAQADLFG